MSGLSNGNTLVPDKDPYTETLWRLSNYTLSPRTCLKGHEVPMWQVERTYNSHTAAPDLSIPGKGRGITPIYKKKFRTYINGCFKTVNDSLTSLLWIIIVPDWIVKFPDRTEYVKLERPANPSWWGFVRLFILDIKLWHYSSDILFRMRQETYYIIVFNNYFINKINFFCQVWFVCLLLVQIWCLWLTWRLMLYKYLSHETFPKRWINSMGKCLNYFKN